MDQAYNSGRDGKKSRQACGDGRQQGYNESFYNGRLAIVPIPVSLSFIGYDAKNDPHRHGEQRTRAQSYKLSAEKHRIDNRGQEYNARVKAEDLSKTSCGSGAAVFRQWIGRHLAAWHILYLRSRVNGIAAD